jgi:hypothetical protein
VDLLSLAQALWRYKLTSAVMLLLTAVAVVGVLVWTPPVYTATASLLLFEPPDPPAQSPSRDVRSQNPYVRYADNSVIINVVARRVQQDRVRERITADGGVETYEVGISRAFGGSSPIIDISVTAGSEVDALRTADLVAARTTRELAAVQEEEDVEADYMFTARTVEKPGKAVLVVAGTLRKAIGVGVLGLGALVLALASRRAWDERRTPRDPPRLVGSTVEVLTPRTSSPRTSSSDDPSSPQARQRS